MTATRGTVDLHPVAPVRKVKSIADACHGKHSGNPQRGALTHSFVRIAGMSSKAVYGASILICCADHSTNSPHCACQPWGAKSGQWQSSSRVGTSQSQHCPSPTTSKRPFTQCRYRARGKPGMGQSWPAWPSSGTGAWISKIITPGACRQSPKPSQKCCRHKSV